MLELLLRPEVKLTRETPSQKLPEEILLAIGSDSPDPLLIDALIDFDNEASVKTSGFSFALDFTQLSDKVLSLLTASKLDKRSQHLSRSAITTMLCSEFSMSYLVADTLATAIRNITDIYAADMKRGVMPTAAQIHMAFTEGVASSQLLHDLMRYDDTAPEQCYANASRAPELAKKLARNAAKQTGLLLIAAESSMGHARSVLAPILEKLMSTATGEQVKQLMNEAGWHPAIGRLVAECWDGLNTPRTKADLIAAINQRLRTEQADNLESQTSEAAHHLLNMQMIWLSGIIR